MIERSGSKLNAVAPRRSGDMDNDVSTFMEVMEIFDTLYDIRLVERISRPNSMAVR